MPNCSAFFDSTSVSTAASSGPGPERSINVLPPEAVPLARHPDLHPRIELPFLISALDRLDRDGLQEQVDQIARLADSGQFGFGQRAVLGLDDDGFSCRAERPTYFISGSRNTKATIAPMPTMASMTF